MINLFNNIAEHPHHFRQLKCGDTLIAMYNCPLENKFVELWSKHNYIICVTEGRKIWHTAQGSFDLRQGSCVFVRKGASIVEQFFDAPFCLFIFFVSDEFICTALRTRSVAINKSAEKNYAPIMAIQKGPALEIFFQSMSFYFNNRKVPDSALLELKFRELILTLADDPANNELMTYFSSLLYQSQSISLQRVMEDNYCFNLRLEQYAELCNRSLSSFKRDFQKRYHTTPGKWLLEKRLNHAMHLISNMDKNVGEASFESGFENPSHFSRSFKERFGVSPAALRQTPVS
jgi:AraC family transcriptional regulator, exoenzyme S synthesis regulatory protein ExsA